MVCHAQRVWFGMRVCTDGTTGDGLGGGVKMDGHGSSLAVAFFCRTYAKKLLSSDSRAQIAAHWSSESHPMDGAAKGHVVAFSSTGLSGTGSLFTCNDAVRRCDCTSRTSAGP